MWSRTSRSYALAKSLHGRSDHSQLARTVTGHLCRSVHTGAVSVGWRKSSCTSACTRSFSSGTALGEYLERCGAIWGDAYEVEPVSTSEDGRTFVWRVDMPPERLKALRRGDPLDSPTFVLPGGCRGRFQLFPRGDSDSSVDGFCSLWLCSDSQSESRIQLRLGDSKGRQSGASDFCRLEDALKNDVLEVSLTLDGVSNEEQPPEVEQSLLLTALKRAEWQLYRAERFFTGSAKGSEVISSPPFRFHHVLLGDMYLEMVPAFPHQRHCALLFRCRVPTMKLRITLGVGSSFSKTLIAVGRSTVQEDLKSANFLQVNMDAPGVLATDGSLTVTCTLDEVVAIPGQMTEMIPKLDERANWPKRI